MQTMKFKEITDEMSALYERKNHDYGNSFSETFNKLGIVSSVTLLFDKMNRLVSLTSKHEQLVNDESLRDTLMNCVPKTHRSLAHWDARHYP